MVKKPDFKGFGGSGGGGRNSAKETAVSGYSVSNASMLGIVSEGEIEGPINGLQGIYFNETPCQNSDGSLNFQSGSNGARNFDGTINYHSFTNFSWDWRPGTQGQSRMPGFGDEVTSETQIGTEVRYAVTNTRTIVNTNLDVIRVRVGVALQENPPSGGTYGLSVQFKIWIQEGSGAFVLRLDQTIGGRFSSLTEFEYAFSVNNYGGTVTSFGIRVERVNPTDADTTRYQRLLKWQSLTEVTETKLAYPNSALFGFKFDATQFQTTPQISLKLAGRKVAIPSNATPTGTRGLTYSGTWDGTFVIPSVATSDPAWILYDLLTNTRYGLGRYINQSQIDKWALYEISQYCNQYVSSGFGGWEHRFQCNTLLNTAEDAYKVIQTFLSIFRGFSYWMSGAIGMAADKPGSTIAQFTQSDIEDGLFNYSRTGLKTRHTIALVTWTNPADFYRKSVEAVDDPEGIAKWGVRELELPAFACTSRGQARRAGMAALLTDRLEMETVTFKVRAFGAYTKPGDIIKIFDAKRADIRYGGLIAGGTTTSVILDNPVEIFTGETYTLTVMLSDGTIQEKSVSSAAGVHSTLALTSALSSSPPPESNWILASTTITPQLFRVLSRVPAAGSLEMMHEITALEYRPEKYAQIESGWSMPPAPVRRNPPVVVNVPRNIALSYRFNDLFNLSAVWDYPLLNGSRDPYTANYEVQIRQGDEGAWLNSRTTPSPATQFENISAGKYYVRVAAIDVNGRSSFWVVSPAIDLTKYNHVATFTSRYTAVFALEF